MIPSSDTLLSDLCLLIADCPHSTPKWTNTGVLVLRSHNIRSGRLSLADRSYTDEESYKQRSRRATVQAGDLVITREAPMGEVCMIPTGLKCCLGQRMVLLRPDPTKCDPRFLLFALQSPAVQHQIGWSEGTGSTVSNLRIPHLEALRIRTPALDEQRAVGAVLGSLDDKIEHNRRTSRALEGLARAMFKAWFVDFEPVHAKAAGATSYPGMPPEAFAALPTRFTDSKLGPVPEGWEVRQIGDVVTVKGGGTPSTKVADYWEGGTHWWATPKDFSDLQDPVLLGTERRLTDAGARCISSGVLPVDTVLLSSRAPVGYTALAKVPTAINQGFIAMVCDGPLPPHFVLHWTRAAMDEIKARASGTTFPEISKTNFRPIPVVVPPRGLLAAFEGVARTMFDLIAANAVESRKLAELRDYLLPKLLSGEVRVGRSAAAVGVS